MAGATIRGYSAVQLLHGWYHVVTGLFGCYIAGAAWLQRCSVVTWLVPRGYMAGTTWLQVCLVVTRLVPRGYRIVWLSHGRVVTDLFGCYMAGTTWLQNCLVFTWLVARDYNVVWLSHGWCHVVAALFGCYMPDARETAA